MNSQTHLIIIHICLADINHAIMNSQTNVCDNNTYVCLNKLLEELFICLCMRSFWFLGFAGGSFGLSVFAGGDFGFSVFAGA